MLHPHTLVSLSQRQLVKMGYRKHRRYIFCRARDVSTSGMARRFKRLHCVEQTFNYWNIKKSTQGAAETRFLSVPVHFKLGEQLFPVMSICCPLLVNSHNAANGVSADHLVFVRYTQARQVAEQTLVKCIKHQFSRTAAKKERC